MLKKDKLSTGLTAFIDILGFGAQVTSATSPHDLEEILEGIGQIRKAFEHDPEDASDRAVHAVYGKSVLAFSDCVIVNVPLASRMTEIEGAFDTLIGELNSMAIAQATCIRHALFMRGGVDLNWWYQDGSTLVSKSLVNAYALEGEASVPVIAVTNQLYEFLANHSGRAAYSNEYDPLPTMIREYSGVVAGRAVNIRHLDYLSIYAREIDWTPTPANQKALRLLPDEERDQQMEAWRLENLRFWFANHARAIELAISQDHPLSVRAKYEWLADYHNEVAPRFTDEDPACICVV